MSNFYEICDDLIKKGKNFDTESLKLLKFTDLILAGCGNAGKAICKDYKLIENEKERRMIQFDDIPLEKLEDIAEDKSMLYSLCYRRAEKLGSWKINDMPFWCQLTYYMKKLRGDWSEGRQSFYFKKILELIPKAKEESLIPIGWIEAVKETANEFDGHYSDGRIFRDGGSYYIPKEIRQSLNLPVDMTKGSGNLASYFGFKTPKDQGFYGGYEELFEKYLTPQQRLLYMKKVEDDEDDW
jgi:hypothetical protein